jgi:sugar phosphate permease
MTSEIVMLPHSEIANWGRIQSPLSLNHAILCTRELTYILTGSPFTLALVLIMMGMGKSLQGRIWQGGGTTTTRLFSRKEKGAFHRAEEYLNAG